MPVVGNVFVFANVGLEALAKFGPATLYNMGIDGTYSTDPACCRASAITGTLNISAFAGLRLRAEGGAGIEVLDHDIKVGVGRQRALAGIRGYVEATPTIGYREVADPAAGKKGEFFITGHMELAAQPFLGLGGDLFVELDSPWWSPAPDKRWTWPLGQLEYPLPGEFGIGADVDHVLGSDKVPEIEFRDGRLQRRPVHDRPGERPRAAEEVARTRRRRASGRRPPAPTAPQPPRAAQPRQGAPDRCPRRATQVERSDRPGRGRHPKANGPAARPPPRPPRPRSSENDAGWKGMEAFGELLKSRRPTPQSDAEMAETA